MSHPENPLNDAIERFAATISDQPLGLAHYRPHPDAVHTNCIANTLAVCDQHGGQPRFGWYFLSRRSPDHGNYLIATHHAVWHNPTDLKLIDVTPFHPDEKHRPLAINDDTLFLVDDAAKPYTNGNKMAPLPSRFHAIDDTSAILDYVAQLQRDEYDSYNLEHGSQFS